MWNRRAAVSGLALFAIAIGSACADTSLTEPAAEANDFASLFGGPLPDPSLPTGIDAEFLSIAQEIPGFGGFYYDGAGTLNVVMAPTMRPLAEAEVRSRLAPRLEAMGQDPSAVQGAVFHAGEYDFAALDALHRRASSVLSLAGVVFTDADEVLNRVTVGVENAAAAAAVEHALAMLGVPTEAVVLRESAPVRASLGEVSPMQSLGDFVRPVAGGLGIQGTGVCTLGFNVRSATFPAQGFVTSHLCTQVPGAVNNQQFWQPTAAPANRIGVEVRDTAFHTGGICPEGRRCRLSATTGAAYHPGVNNAFARIYRTIPGSNTIDPTNAMFNITAERSFPSVGDLMNKVGRTTGWTSGTVTQSCVLTNVAGTDITYRCQEWVTGPTNVFGGGESGSPVFDNIVGNDVRLVGMAWGQTASNNFIFSAMIEIRSDNPARPAGAGGPWRTFPPPPAP
jgi:hypothetical protein